MFIQTESTQDPATLKFLPGQQVLADGKLVFEDS
ncbi:MAG: NifU family protein, partial [Bradyrhizobium sp.]